MPTIRTAVLAVVGLAGMLLTFYPTLFSGFDRMQPEAGDILLNNLFFEHTYRWAFDPDYPFAYWSPGFFHPTPYTFTYSETLTGTAPLYWLLRVWFSESVACQVWVLITYALNFVSMAVVLRWFGVNSVLTAAGAYVFAFGLIRADHLTHQHMMVQYFSPLAVWYAWAFLHEPTSRRWSLLVGLAAMQILASLHLGWFLGFGLLIFVVWGFAVEAGSWGRAWAFARRRPVATVLPLLLAGLVVGAYARNFYMGAPGPRAYWEAAMYGPYPDGWFMATPGSLWADHLTPRHPDAFPEKALFQGFAVYAVFLAAGWYACRRRFPGRGLVLAGVGTALVLALCVTRWGYNVSIWYLIHQVVPGANAFRAIGRIAFVAYMLSLIGGLVGLQALVNEKLPRRRNLIFTLIAVAMILEQVRPFPESFDKRGVFFDRAEALVPHLAGVDAAYVVDNESLPDYRHEITAMWAGLWAKVPVMNGFSGTKPRDYPGIGERPTVEELVRALGPTWKGRLAVIEWGPPIRRRVYQVEPGDEAARRFRIVEQAK
jgi:hypothetical protein